MTSDDALDCLPHQAELHTLQKQHELEKEILISSAKIAEQQQQEEQQQQQQQEQQLEERLRRNAPSEPPPTPPASKQQHLLQLLAAGPARPRAASRDSVASTAAATPVATSAGPSKYYSDEEEAMMALYAEADQADPERVDEDEAEACASHRRAIDALAAAATPALDALAASAPRGLTGGGDAGGGDTGGVVSPSSRVQALLSETAPEGTWSAVPHAQQPPSTAPPGLAQLGARPNTTLGVSRGSMDSGALLNRGAQYGAQHGAQHGAVLGEPLPNTKQRVEAALDALYRKNGGEAPGLLLQQVRIPNSRIQRVPRPGEPLSTALSPPDAALPVTSTLLRGLAAWPSPSPASRMPLPAEL